MGCWGAVNWLIKRTAAARPSSGVERIQRKLAAAGARIHSSPLSIVRWGREVNLTSAAGLHTHEARALVGYWRRLNETRASLEKRGPNDNQDGWVRGAQAPPLKPSSRSVIASARSFALAFLLLRGARLSSKPHPRGPVPPAAASAQQPRRNASRPLLGPGGG